MNTEDLKDIKESLATAKGIAWDTCHKIYVLMDDNQVNIVKDYGYKAVIESRYASPELMLKAIREWYKGSCPLKYIHRVTTNSNNDTDFYCLVAQN